MAEKLVIEKLNVTYSDGTHALKDVNLQIAENEITSIFGPARGGKSTLLRMLNRLSDLSDIRDVTGSILLNGHNILDRTINVMELRRRGCNPKSFSWMNPHQLWIQ